MSQVGETNENIPHSRTWQPLYEDEPSIQSTHEINLGLAELSLKGDDSVISLENQGVYGVFDGMGGYGGPNAGATASRLALNTCRRAYESEAGFGQGVMAEKQRLAKWLHSADQQMSKEGYMGTTATVLRIVEEANELHAVWASIGDSRLYLYRDKQIYQITRDEGYGHMLSNYLGGGNCKIEQVNNFKLKNNDRLMLCSDGITGDYEPDLLAPADMKEAFDASTSQASANLFLTKSRKRDDKSVIVVDIAQEISTSALHEHRLQSDERVFLNVNKPIEYRGNYNLVAQIKAADKELRILDIRPLPGESDHCLPFGETAGYWDADFLVIDETFFGKWGQPSYGKAGFKGVRANEGKPIEFGREHTHGRFQFSNKVSRTHFAIEYSEAGLYLVNRKPTNLTVLTTKR